MGIVKGHRRHHQKRNLKKAGEAEKKPCDLKKLRPSLVPGAVVIILVGRFAGRRAVFLKRLDSGLLLISGPYKFNGVPLRRIAPAYVIATSTKVDISGVDVSEVTDKTFSSAASRGKRKGAERFFAFNNRARKALKAKTLKKFPLDKSRVELQKKVDEPLVAACEKVELLPQYLHSLFTLKAGQYPHAMKF